MWMDLLLFALAISPLALVKRPGWQQSEAKPRAALTQFPASLECGCLFQPDGQSAAPELLARIAAPAEQL